MDFSADIKNIRKIIAASLMDEALQQTFLKRLESIERRLNDSKLNVGIVGEFSSGKSTLINSLIGQDYFVTNSIQGTTTVITSIRYGRTINLELRYKNGKIIRYSKSKLSLIKKFLPNEYEKLSFADKLGIKTKGFLGLNGKDSLMLKIFDIVTTSNEISPLLEEVIVYYPSEFLKKGIVLIDTPGTDSLIEAHAEITQNAIANKCDLAFVIIPALTPVSVTLSDFISENLTHCIDSCHFLATKIEMVKKDREYHLAGIKKRLINLIKVENPHVIAAPTLLSLEESNIIEPTGLMKGLSSDERKALTSQFDIDIAQLFNHLYNNREHSKKTSVKNLLHDLLKEIYFRLNDIRALKQEHLSSLQANRTPPLETLLNGLNRDNLSSIHENAIYRIKNTISYERSSFLSYVLNEISIADTKDAIQASISTEESIKKGGECFNNCYDIAIQQAEWLISYYKEEVLSLSTKFRELYSLDPLAFEPGKGIHVVAKKIYTNRFNTDIISTFLPKRMFMKKETIREEMRDAVRNYMTTIFDDELLKHYSSKIKKMDKKLSMSVDKLVRKYQRKHTKTVNARIALEMKKEKSFSGEIGQIDQQITAIQSYIKNYQSSF